MDDVRSWFAQPATGTVETAAAPWWRLMLRMQPDIRIALIRRPAADVTGSLARYGFDPARTAPLMARLDRKLDQIEARVPGVLSVTFGELATEEGCARLFEHCLPYKHDPAWYAIMAPRDLQINLAVMARYARAFAPQMGKLAKIAKHATIAGMGHGAHQIDGMTIAVEPFDTFLRDGRPLFERHLIEVGEAPDAWRAKNLPLMRALDGMGAMQVLTARSNGRMFGYLMTIIAPSLESAGVLSAQHLTFYASADAPGLGMKLQRAAIDALRERGVGEVFLRAGVRGEGPRLGTIYRRLGAEDFGQMFKLELGAG